IEFIREIVRQLGEPKERLPEKKSDLLDLLGKILERDTNIGREIVIIIDEAQLIESRETFEELRLLLNFQLNERFLLTLVLLGQPELREKIANLPQLKQRLSVRYHLSNLDEKETGKYINQRLKIAGQKKEIFGSETISLIHQASQGLPREINNICDLSLLTGMGKEVAKIDKNIIREVIKDLEG
ncbi:AAA family ATPase, partial [bacterium]|nr:AAA family ATPase [bacterium]